MKILLVILAFVCLSYQAPVNFDFEGDSTILFNRIYKDDAERAMRFKTFQENVNQMFEHQQKQPKVKFGINKFSDWTKEEKAKLSGVKYTKPMKRGEKKAQKTSEKFNLPNSFDWRQRGMVTPVKDQGQCGSCWTFQSIAMVESNVLINGNPQVILSEQELIDCDNLDGSDGCNGGTTDAGLEFIIQNGVETEQDYPYQAQQGDCQASSDAQGLTYIKSYTWFGNDNQQAASQMMNLGPLGFDIYVPDSLMNYESGVYAPTDDECQTAINNNAGHAVTIVGFGNSDGPSYWIIKNSWGADWGLNGYFWMIRGDGDEMACVGGKGDGESYYAAITG